MSTKTIYTNKDTVLATTITSMSSDRADDGIWIVGDKYHEKVNFPQSKSTTAALSAPLPGGVWYVQRFLNQAIESRGSNITTWTYTIPPHNDQFAATHTLGSYSRRPRDRSKALRIRSTNNYKRNNTVKYEILNEGLCPKQLLIIEDMNLGYRTNGKAEWAPLLKSMRAHRKSADSQDIIVLLGGELPQKSEWLNEDINSKDYSFWTELLRHHSKNTIVVVNADLLRFTGANISRRISWERTAQDLITELQNYPLLQELGRFAHVIIRFGVTAAVHCFKVGDDIHRMLYYDTKAHDGIFRDITTDGAIIGNNSVFTACIAMSLLDGAPPTKATAKIGIAIKSAIPACQRMFRLGYPRLNPSNKGTWPYQWPSSAIFDDKYHEKTIEQTDPTSSGLIRHSEIPSSVENWSILRQSAAGASIVDLARRIVFRGIRDSINLPENSKDALTYSTHGPIARFGDVIVIDRDEIENLRGVFNLIKQYQISPSDERPLCIAMFGPPGSGKSFIIKKILKELNFPDDWPQPTVNLTQVSSLEKMGDNIVAQFHETYRVLRKKEMTPVSTSLASVETPKLNNSNADIATLHKRLKPHDIPVIFFDEFDCEFGSKLGWLKTLLAPMEDGLLGPTTNTSFISLKRSILIFAGGTKRTYKEFACETPSCSDEERLNFEGVKGPDFVSRLRGYVDIKGINRTSVSDTAFLLRRAIILRELLWENKLVHGKRDRIWGNHPHRTKKLAQIDYSVIHAMLKVSSYKHGARSMRALVSMCIPLLRRIEKASLPSMKLLDMHVDSIEFRSLLDEFQSTDHDNRPKPESYFLT